MPPTFYFAIGARPTLRDLEIALAVGQQQFLAPARSAAARMLKDLPAIHGVLDSGA